MRFWVIICLILSYHVDLKSQEIQKRRRPKQKTTQQMESSVTQPRWTWDLSLSQGSYNEVNYTEFHLGLQNYWGRYFIWRNAFFGHFQEDNNFYGLDTSGRFTVALGDPSFGIQPFLGPGYRFVSRGKAVPFGEGGLHLFLGGLHIGIGAKVLLFSLIEEDLKNDTQLFLIVSGGGSF